VVVAWGLYFVFQPVNRSLSLLAALLRVVYATMFAIAVNNLLSALQVVGGADFLKAFGTDQMQAQMMVLLGAFQSGWDLALIVFGLHLFVLGILVFSSGKTGLRVVGILVTAAGVGYLIDGVGKVLVPNYSLTIAMYTFVGEPLLIFWLLTQADAHTAARKGRQVLACPGGFTTGALTCGRRSGRAHARYHASSQVRAAEIAA